MNEIASNNPDSTDFFSNAFLLGNIGAPFLIGMAVGYFAKKMLLLALFVGGGIITALFAAEYYGIISINGDALLNSASAAADAAKQSGGFLLDRLSMITSRGISGAGGFYVGFKLG